MTREEAKLGMTYVNNIESIKEELSFMERLHGIWNKYHEKPRLKLQLDVQGNPTVTIDSKETIEKLLDIANEGLEKELAFYEGCLDDL